MKYSRSVHTIYKWLECDIDICHKLIFEWENSNKSKHYQEDLSDSEILWFGVTVAKLFEKILKHNYYEYLLFDKNKKLMKADTFFTFFLNDQDNVTDKKRLHKTWGDWK